MKTLPIALLVFATTALNGNADQLPEELVKKLRAAIEEHCPDAQIEVTESGFTAKHGTMMFTLHSKSKTGEVYPQTYQEEGPNFKGFLLRVSIQKGPYQGAAVIPQTLQGPYFPTFIDAPATDDGRNYYWVMFSVGSRLDEKTRDALFDAIPKTKLQPGDPANGSKPLRSEPDQTTPTGDTRR